MADDPFKYFRVEAKELSDQLLEGVLDLERGGGAGAVRRLLRAAHTLKGAARVVKHRAIADETHALEDALGPYRSVDAGVGREVIAALLAKTDAIAQHVAELAPAAVAPASSAAQAPAKVAPEVTRTVRADASEMDALLEAIAEVSVQLDKVRRSFTEVERARGLADLLRDQIAARQREARSAQPSGGPGALLTTYALAEELRGTLSRADRAMSLAIDQAERELAQARDAAQGMRLVPASDLFAACERAARDAAQALGKLVRVETAGGGVRLEADALFILQGALIQLVRNAVAHGIEATADRLRAGKADYGTIRLELKRNGDRIACACRDDGRGVDLEALRRTAVARGRLSESDRPDADGLLQLMLEGGISTAGRVTEVSGRGVGLDVVREAAERLSGEVRIHTERGQGTTIELVMPMSLASFAALRVQAAGAVAVIPLDSVKRTLRTAAHEVVRAGEEQQIVVDGRAIPFMPLASVLGLEPSGAGAAAQWSSVLIEAGGRRVAIGADRLLDTTFAVLKPLGPYAPAHATIAGAALDARGAPELVLEPEGVVSAVSRGGFGAPSSTARRRSVLVIDDSLTTRMLEQSILESAGYEVTVAASAEEGLELALRDLRYELFLVDVEMPGIDGFELVRRVRSDPKLRDTPVILVTSRNAPADRARGVEVGASGYIVKSEFDQIALLALIRTLLRQP